MRKLVYTAFVAFWAVVATLFVVDHLGRGRDVAPEPAPETAASKTYTLDEVGRHDGADDCWMAIEGAVYDLTDYVPRHPAPPAILVEWCGREASQGMRTKGKDRGHSDRAWRLLKRYRIGELVDSS